jgi:type II secretory pathway pseudopilin PulG
MKQCVKIRLADRSAYTLLEVLLALGLTVVIFTAIAAGIRLHLVSIAQQQLKIEQRQIARNLLTTIGTDIRSAVLYRATDYSGLENIRATALKQGGTSGITVGDLLSDPEAAAATEAAGNSEETTIDPDEEIEGLIQEDDVSYRPVLRGSDRSIQFDISRLPRLDQYRSFGANGGEAVASTPSDIKSISYFFSTSPSVSEPLAQLDPSIAPGGLYRREVDRAIASFAGLDGLSTNPDSVSRLLAPEVAAVRFRYFDGFDWWTSWDFDERGGLPTAVEIQLTVDPTRTVAKIANDFAQAQPTFYRSVVHLPLAEPREEEE